MIFPRLRVFVSSRMAELAAERRRIKEALAELGIDCWIYEEDAGARPQPARQTFLEEIEGADLYLGVFWQGYGSYTLDEYEHARSRSKDCLVYEKRIAPGETRDPQLQEWLDRIADVETGITLRRFSDAEELTRFVKEDVARWQAAIVRKYRARPPTQHTIAIAPGQRRSVEILRKQVRQIWIEQVLAASIHGADILALGKEHRAEALEYPWEAMLERPTQQDEAIPPGKTIWDVFKEVDRSLLILGQPGSGKTTTLLQLCRFLLDRADADPLEPTPVVLHLSAWDARRPFIDWLTGELSEKYRIPARLGRPLLEGNRLTLLLDGLDEVAERKRAACVAAINSFTEEVGHAGFVVCCRVEEYSSLSMRLKLNGAIALQPLTTEQILSFASGAAVESAVLPVLLREDRVLQEEARSPLLLSIMVAAYEGRSLEELRGGALATREARRKHLFDAYVERMFERRKPSGRTYSRKQTISWLAWLARRLHDESQSIFLTEGLQPGWLTRRWQQWAYFVVLRLGVGLLWGVLAGAFFETVEMVVAPDGIREIMRSNGFWIWLAAVPAWTLGTGLFHRTLARRRPPPADDVAAFSLPVIITTVTYLALWVLVWATLLRSWPFLPGGTISTVGDVRLMPPVLAGILIAQLFAILDRRSGLRDAVGGVEALGWFWRRAVVGAGGGMLVGLIIWGVRLVFASGPVWLYLVVGGMAGALVGGLRGCIVTGKTTPNQGIRMSARNALSVGVAAALVTALIARSVWGWLPDSFVLPYSHWPPGSLPATVQDPAIRLALIVLLGAAFWFGGLDVLKHYLLRSILAVSGKPIRLVRFLDHAASRTLLQKVGGGFMFRHRLLLEHFAEPGGAQT